MAATMALLAACASASAPHRFEFQRVAMGVDARIVLYAEDGERARDAAEAAFDRIAAVEDALSDWRPASELSRLGDGAGGDATPVGPDLLDALRRAREIAEASDGAFDPTVGPVIALWRASRRTGALAEEHARAVARDLVGWRRLELDGGAGTARLATAGMRLDLGGIGKGFAADRAVETLRARGARRCLVSLAGDFVAGDPPPDRDAWIVALGPGSPEPGRRVRLARAAVSTSGTAEQWVEIDGVRWAHLVDPRTGLGLREAVSATVVAADGATADALATAFCVATREQAAALRAVFPEAWVLVGRQRPGNGV